MDIAEEQEGGMNRENSTAVYNIDSEWEASV